ncbi:MULTISPECIES: HD domain-containing protein [Rhizobium]|uniref:(P)ppGpp synthase/HD superfamily hydrolase n=1 Tax=Rhizobium paranaense TaxID=1650438 RepID=A0A7W9D4Y4_9HYPH|nr:HD domain-containing protein [Rhizobium paranaense]MBB5577967.1 (p)ppGpp synthase/HD superfamily hydrolase [Rhizobium paranaense]
MLSTDPLDHAMKIATEAHAGQADKLGNPYVEHCRRVALAVSGENEKIVAYLHDVVEKGPGWTIDRLRQEGFSPSVLSAVDALTKHADEDENAFVHRAIANAMARPVKKADLEDNLWQQQRIGGDTDKYRRDLDTIREQDDRFLRG